MAYTAVTKDTGWLDKLNANDLDNLTTDTGWKQDGIVYVNGFSTSTSTLSYRIVTFGNTGLKHVYITGYISLNNNTGVIKSGTPETIVNLPQEVFSLIDNTVGNCKSIVGRGTVSNGGLPMAFGLSVKGELSLTPRVDFQTYESFFVDLICVIKTN
jgi:hypothetical protein